jgi:hypothetical protein
VEKWIHHRIRPGPNNVHDDPEMLQSDQADCHSHENSVIDCAIVAVDDADEVVDVPSRRRIDCCDDVSWWYSATWI